MKPASSQPFKTQLTSRGWGILLFSIIGIGMGRILGLFELIVLSICLIILLIFLVPTRWLLKKIDTSCKVIPFRVQCCETSNLQIELKGVRKFFRFEIKVENITGNQTVWVQDSSFSKADPERLGVQTINCNIEARKRGIVELGPIQLVQIDPFGIITNKKKTNARSTLIVHPIIFPIKFPFLDRGDAHKLAARFNIQGSEFHSLRKYQTGDDITHIHWKSSAKKNELVIQQFEKNELDDFFVSIFIDNRAGVSEEIFEEMISAAASITNVCERNGNRVQLLTACGKECVTNGYEVLDFLSQLNQIEETQDHHTPLTNKAKEFLQYAPESHLTIGIIGEPIDEDAFLFQRELYSSNQTKFFFFGNQSISNQSSNLISNQQPFHTAWEAMEFE